MNRRLPARDSMDKIEEIQKTLSRFALDREWDRFHSPKNLSMALSKEASELLEIFQWLTEEESCSLPPEKMARVRDELGDVFNCLLQLAARLDIDIVKATEEKIVKNGLKYPVEKSRGNARKYTEL